MPDNVMDPKASIEGVAGCFIVVLGILSIASNCIAFGKLLQSPIERSIGLYLRVLCVVSALSAIMTILSTSLTLSAVLLHDDTVCVLLGATIRLIRAADHLFLIITFINALCTSEELHPQKQTLKIALHALAIIWAAIVVCLEILCQRTAFKHRPGLIFCDVQLDHVFIEIDSLIFCVPVAIVLVLSTGILVVESKRQNEISSLWKLSLNQESPSTPVKQMAMGGVCISALKTIEWATRVSAVVGSQHLHSPSLFTLSVLVMIVGNFSIPSTLVLSLQTSEEEPPNDIPTQDIRRAMAVAVEQEEDHHPSRNRGGSYVFRRPKSKSNHFVSKPLKASIFDSIEITRYNLGMLQVPLHPSVRRRSFHNTHRLDLGSLKVPLFESTSSRSSDALVPIHDALSRTSNTLSTAISTTELICNDHNGLACHEHNGLTCHDHNGLTYHEHNGLTYHDHNGLACHDHNGLACHEHNGLTCHEHNGLASHEHNGLTCHEHSGLTYHEHNGLTCNDHNGLACHEHNGLASHEHNGLTCHEQYGLACHEHKGLTRHEHNELTRHEHNGLTRHEHNGLTRHEHNELTRHEHNGLTRHEHNELTRHEHSELTRHEHNELTRHEHDELTRHEHNELTRHEHNELTRHEHNELTRHEHDELTRHEHNELTRHEHNELTRHEHDELTRHEHDELTRHEHNELTRHEHNELTRHEHNELTRHEHNELTRHEHDELTRREGNHTVADLDSLDQQRSIPNICITFVDL